MSKSTLLYELSVIAKDDLRPVAGELAEAVGRGADEVERAVAATFDRYERGEITQATHWAEIALKLALEDTETIGAFALNSAAVDQGILGRIRGQSPVATLGLVSDATPDWVGHFRKRYQLDELIHVHVIGSELDEERDYPGLLTLSAERLQAAPDRVSFVGRRPVHLEHARAVGMPVIDLSETTDLAAAFRGL